MNNKIGRICLLFVFLSLAASLSYSQKKAPNVLNYKQLQEKIEQSSVDSILVINFWATWCSPCVEEMPILESIPQMHKGIPVKVLLVSLDFTDQIDLRVLPFMIKKGIINEVLVLDEDNPNNWIPKVDPNWSGAIPACLFIHKKRSSFHEGKVTPSIIESSMNSLLP